ncbi:MAG TPA: hypothetical protein VKV15_02410 [Bryobacteraceae bacterium]|nr:hypothetical protein [Bryobacteraceae bacterium]
MKKLLLHGVVAAAALRSSAFAQGLRTATLAGAVTGSSGAAVANAAVTVIGTDTHVVTRGKTNESGAIIIEASSIELLNYSL